MAHSVVTQHPNLLNSMEPRPHRVPPASGGDPLPLAMGLGGSSSEPSPAPPARWALCERTQPRNRAAALLGQQEARDEMTARGPLPD